MDFNAIHFLNIVILIGLHLIVAHRRSLFGTKNLEFVISSIGCQTMGINDSRARIQV
jgi:fatty-acid desaturase